MPYRSDDYIDGMQRAYNTVFKLMERTHGLDTKRVIKSVLDTLDQDIQEAVGEQPVKIIIP